MHSCVHLTKKNPICYHLCIQTHLTMFLLVLYKVKGCYKLNIVI